MAYTTPVQIVDFCRTIQKDLVLAGESNPALLMREPTGLLSALRSPQNDVGNTVEQTINPGDGKQPIVMFRYMRPEAQNSVTDEITDICEEEGVPGSYVNDLVTVDREIATSVSLITEDEMRTMCESMEERKTKLINGKLNALFRAIDQNLIADYNSGVGTFMDGAASHKTLKLIERGGTQPEIVPYGQIQMMRDYQDAGATGRPIIVGDRTLADYFDLKGIACCSDFAQDASRLEDLAWFRDNNIWRVLDGPSDNAETFFMWQPGAAQFLSVPYNVGAFRKVTPDYVYDTFTDPVTGITVDYEMRYQSCGTRGYTFRLSLHYGLWQLPTDMFVDDDDRDGINYNFAYIATEAA